VATDGDDDLPEPEIETIRNLAPIAPRGAVVALDGEGVRNNSVDVRVMSRVLTHFDRLVRILRADRGGFEIKRRGRIVEVKGARRLAALPAIAGSYVVPLRLDDPEGEMVIADHNELEGVVTLLAEDEEAMQAVLSELPERVGDELLGLLRVLAAGSVDLRAYALRDGETTARAEVRAEEATRRSAWLADPAWSEPGVDSLRGTLFRIDTRRGRIAIDVSKEDDPSAVVEEASFSLDLLEDLRKALHREVQLEVSVIEQRRRYERSARGRLMTVTRVLSVGEGDIPLAEPDDEDDDLRV
jgi:hypothetical protein